VPVSARSSRPWRPGRNLSHACPTPSWWEAAELPGEGVAAWRPRGQLIGTECYCVTVASHPPENKTSGGSWEGFEGDGEAQPLQAVNEPLLQAWTLVLVEIRPSQFVGGLVAGKQVIDRDED
jgi:hypothetical protein